MKSRLRRALGLTLMELMMVLIILGMAFGVVTLGARALDMSELDSAALRLAGTMRYAFDTATLQTCHVRLTFDLDANTYSLDAAAEADLLDPERVRVRSGEAIFHVDREKAKEEGTTFGSTGGGGLDPFTALLEEEKRDVKLRSPVKFHGVFTPAYDGVVQKGQVTIRFFPLGYGERAIIYLTTGEDHFVTLILHPYLGRVDVEPGYVPVPDEDREERGAEKQETFQ